jgi:hypothetical protein
MISCRESVISQPPVSASRARPGPLPAFSERKTVRKVLTTVRSRVEYHMREVAVLGGTGEWEIPNESGDIPAGLLQH